MSTLLGIGYFLAENGINAQLQGGMIDIVGGQNGRSGYFVCRLMIDPQGAIVSVNTFSGSTMAGWEVKAEIDLNDPDSLSTLLRAIRGLANGTLPNSQKTT
jgi:hypothetical protein